MGHEQGQTILPRLGQRVTDNRTLDRKKRRVSRRGGGPLALEEGLVEPHRG